MIKKTLELILLLLVASLLIGHATDYDGSDYNSYFDNLSERERLEARECLTWITAEVSPEACIRGLDSLPEDYDLHSHYNLGIIANKAPNLEGLKELTHVKGRFLIQFTNGISDFEGLSNLNSIGGTFRIAENENLQTLAGLEELDSIYGTLEILNNPSLLSNDGFPELKYLGEGIHIRGNKNLTALNWPKIHSGDRFSLQVSRNKNLKEISGFSGPPNIDSLLWYENNSLESISGFKDTRTLKYLHIEPLPKLTHFSAFPNLKSLNKGYLEGPLPLEIFTTLTGASTIDTLHLQKMKTPFEFLKQQQSTLQVLFLQDPTDEGLLSFPEGEKALSDLKITGAAKVESLSLGQGFTNLKRLEISHMQLLSAIQLDLTTFPSLDSLIISYNPQLCQDRLTLLGEDLPDSVVFTAFNNNYDCGEDL